MAKIENGLFKCDNCGKLLGSSDLVPVIRCRDCVCYREYHFGGFCLGVLAEPSAHRSPWDFCSQAVRKKESNYEN